LDVAAAAESAASYCRLRERGLRNDAFAHLREFIREAQQWSLPERARFADWILSLQRSHPQIYDLIPYPLQQDLIEPTLRDWCRAEPMHPVRYRWLGTDEDLRRAVELDPAEQVARQLFIERVAGAVDFSIHELSSGYEYLGDPEDDLRQLREAEEMLQGIKDVERRNHYTQELSCCVRLSRDAWNAGRAALWSLSCAGQKRVVGG
jgi:hypothetical protein